MTTCLVVDDSRVVRKTAKRMLSELNIEASEAEHGEEAFRSCSTSMPDFILLDWNMPVMDGLDFLRKLRGTSFERQPKVLFCTSESDFSKIAQALDAGADEYIMKPFDSEILASKLQMIGIL